MSYPDWPDLERVLVSTTFAADQTPIADALRLCRQHDVIGVELGSNHCFTEDPVGQVTAFQEQNYIVHNYFPPAPEDLVINIASTDSRIREASIAHIFNCLEFSQSVGAGLYTFHPGFRTDPEGVGREPGNYDFQFGGSQVAAHDEAFDIMTESIREIVAIASDKDVSIAIETEGSVDKRDYLLMQTAEEFDTLFQDLSPGVLGVNLNLGHLNLAAAAFGFERSYFVDAVAGQVVAMELSHNEGKMDDHRPLEVGAWYWDVICDHRFVRALKVLEYRNTPIEIVADSYNFCREQVSQ
jgi:sugar phosphate isomerase/epimerase